LSVCETFDSIAEEVELIRTYALKCHAER